MSLSIPFKKQKTTANQCLQVACVSVSTFGITALRTRSKDLITCQCETENRPSPQKPLRSPYSKILSHFFLFYWTNLTLSAIYIISSLKSTSTKRNICIMLNSAMYTLNKLNYTHLLFYFTKDIKNSQSSYSNCILCILFFCINTAAHDSWPQ